MPFVYIEMKITTFATGIFHTNNATEKKENDKVGFGKRDEAAHTHKM